MNIPIQVKIDTEDPQTVNISYPHLFEENHYLRPDIRLEIGPLAEWVPHHTAEIVPYVAEQFRDRFPDVKTHIATIDVERTFWEKTTILHKVANRDTSSPFPARYARHYYDLYCMYHSSIKDNAFARSELLERDITFKRKFYPSNNSGYDTASIGTLKLLPQVEDMKRLYSDYANMKEMIYGNVPNFHEIIDAIAELEEEINALSITHQNYFDSKDTERNNIDDLSDKTIAIIGATGEKEMISQEQLKEMILNGNPPQIYNETTPETMLHDFSDLEI